MYFVVYIFIYKGKGKIYIVENILFILLYKFCLCVVNYTVMRIYSYLYRKIWHKILIIGNMKFYRIKRNFINICGYNKTNIKKRYFLKKSIYVTILQGSRGLGQYRRMH